MHLVGRSFWHPAGPAVTYESKFDWGVANVLDTYCEHASFPALAALCRRRRAFALNAFGVRDFRHVGIICGLRVESGEGIAAEIPRQPHGRVGAHAASLSNDGVDPESWDVQRVGKHRYVGP